MGSKSAGGMVEISFDFRGIEGMLRAGEREYEVAAASSINRALAKVRTSVIREIAQRAVISPISLVRRRLKIDRAKPSRLQGVIRILLRPIPVIKLSGARQTKTGVTAYHRTYPSAFIRHGRGHGPLMVFQRVGEERKPLIAHKVEISQIAQEVLARRINEAAAYAAEIMPKEIIWRMENRTY